MTRSRLSSEMSPMNNNVRSGRLMGRVLVIGAVLLASVAAPAQTYIFGRADFAVGNFPTSVTAGDFNGDGVTDLAVNNSGDNTVSVLLGKTDGTFAPQVTYATGPEPIAVVTGDFNGDGNLDIAVANGNCTPVQLGQPVCTSSTVSILLGNGDGTFQPHVDYAVGTLPSSLLAADFNGDGKLDLAVTNAFGGTVSVLLGNGDGTFQPQVVYATAGKSAWQSVVTGDFNGDGKLDLAVSCSSVVSVLLGNGDGTFRVHVDSGVGGISLATGDFNRDGRLDLAVTGSPSLPLLLSVLLGNGDGTFTLKEQYPGGWAVAASGLRGDGILDLIVSGAPDTFSFPTDSVGVLLGNGDGTFQTAVNYGTGVSPFGFLVADLNGDGEPDLAVTDSGCFIVGNPCTGQEAPPGAISVLLGFGDGTFVGKTDYAYQGGASAIVSADFNKDGNQDLATANEGGPSVSVLLGNADGTFQPQASYTVGQLPSSIAAADFRNNGGIDLVTANEICVPHGQQCNPGTVSVLLGNGNGTFQTNTDYGVGVAPMGVAVGDFRGNGKLDLVTTNGESSSASVLLGIGDGTFQTQISYLTAAKPEQIATGDFNQDGKLDLAVTSLGHVSILLGNGDGTFKNHVDYPPVGESFAIVTADFNGDGKLDLAVGNAGGVSILLGNGDGTFKAPVNYPTYVPLQGVSALAVTDFNQDGKLDLAVSAGNAESLIFLGNGDGTFRQPIQYLLANLYSLSLTVGDFNHDGTPDWAAADVGTAVGVMLSAAFKAISPGSLNFGSQGVGTTGPAHAVTISNPSNVNIKISSIAATGQFNQTNDCPTELTLGARCTVNVTFSPTTTGLQSGAINLADNTRISPLTISLTGTGVNGPFLTPYPRRRNFSTEPVGTPSSPEVIALANTGNASLSITAINITGANAADFSQTNNCPSSLPVGASCNVNVTFTPSAGGTRTADLAVTDTAPGSPQTIALSGVGVDFSIAPASGSPSSQTISAGQGANFSLEVAPSGGFTGTLNLTCAIAPMVTLAPTCNLSTSSVQLTGSGSQPLTVTVGTTAPTKAGTVTNVDFPSGWMPLVWAGMLLGFGWLLLQDRTRRPVRAAQLAVLVLALGVGCGGGGSSSHSTPGTPAGTYTATVTAVSGAMSHNATLTVVVQ